MFNFASVPVTVLWLDEAAKEESWCGGGFWTLRGGIRKGCVGTFGRKVALFQEQTTGHQLRCQFKCPQTWTTVPAFTYDKAPASSIQLFSMWVFDFLSFT